MMSYAFAAIMVMQDRDLYNTDGVVGKMLQEQKII